MGSDRPASEAISALQRPFTSSSNTSAYRCNSFTGFFFGTTPRSSSNGSLRGSRSTANAPENPNLTMNLAFTDKDPYLLTVHADIVPHERDAQAAVADATLTMPRLDMFAILNRDVNAQAASIADEGDQGVIAKLTEHLTAFDFFFGIVGSRKKGAAWHKPLCGRFAKYPTAIDCPLASRSASE